jgi:GcrA cell cycle regulator
MRNQVLWTAEEETILRQKWTHLSAREIGKLINRSKNSVVGKAHRLELEDIKPKKVIPKPRPSHKKKAVDTVATMVPIRKLPKAPTFYAPARPLSGLPPIGIMELTGDTCRAIVGHAADGLATYCGDFTFPKKSYCPTHCALYYREPEKRLRA